MSQQLLNTGGSVVLNAAGAGTVTLQPDHANQRWKVQRIAVQTNQAPTATPIPVCGLYKDTTGTTNFKGATYSGSNDTFDPAGGPVEVSGCEAITLSWTGGIPGTIASCTVDGLKYGIWD